MYSASAKFCQALLEPYFGIPFLARDSICYSALYAISRPSVTRVDQSKTVEVRIMRPLPQSSPMTLVS